MIPTLPRIGTIDAPNGYKRLVFHPAGTPGATELALQASSAPRVRAEPIAPHRVAPAPVQPVSDFARRAAEARLADVGPEAIKAARAQLGLTQAQLSGKLGILRPTVAICEHAPVGERSQSRVALWRGLCLLAAAEGITL